MKKSSREDWKKAKVGDLVYGYEKGLHRVVQITEGCGCGYCFHLVRVLDSTFKKTHNRKSCCDGHYIKLTNKQELEELVRDYTQEALDNVKNLI